MKVAIYTGSIPAPIFIETLINSLASQGIQVYLFGRKMSSHLYSSSNIYLFPTPNHSLLLIGFIMVNMIRLMINKPRKCYRLVKHYRKISKSESISFLKWWGKVLPVANHLPDVFHVQWAKALPYWFFLKELFRIPIVLSLRGSHITYSPLADKNLSYQYMTLFPKVDKFHAVSKSIKEIACKYGIEQKNIDLIYSAVNLEKIKPFIKSDWRKQGKFQFLSVGRFHWVKGYHYSLLAIKNLLNNNFSVNYTIITSDDPNEEILYQISDLSLKDNVFLFRSNSQDDVYQKMRASDCMLLPSVQEGIANVVMEAMAIGLPVISSDCGGMKEIIDHKENGFLFYNRDVDSLTDVMSELINLGTAQRKIIAERARKKIVQKYNSHRLGIKMKELYHSVNIA